MKTNLLRMTWPEIQEARDRDATLLIPVASVEPAGRQAPVGGQHFIGEHVAENVARRTGSVWLPMIPYGYAPTFMGFPGTISVRPETLAAYLEDVCAAMISHGFRHIMTLNCDNGNEQIIAQVAHKLKREKGLTLANVYVLGLMNALAREMYPESDWKRIGGHGGEPGVSVKYALLPDDMRLDLAVDSKERLYQGIRAVNSKVSNGSASWNLFLNVDEVNDDGGVGDSSQASRERGQAILNRMVDWLVEAVRTFGSIDTRWREAREQGA